MAERREREREREREKTTRVTYGGVLDSGLNVVLGHTLVVQHTIETRRKALGEDEVDTSSTKELVGGELVVVAIDSAAVVRRELGQDLQQQRSLKYRHDTVSIIARARRYTNEREREREKLCTWFLELSKKLSP